MLGSCPRAATPTVRVVKRKWDRTLSTVDTAHPLSVPGDTSAWLVLAGSRRERPRRGTIDVVGGDELWVATSRRVVGPLRIPGREPVAEGVQDPRIRSLRGPRSDSEITWVDLDLDFAVTGGELALLDEDEFHEHARTMAYPDHVVRGAWSGIATIAARYTNSDWPFDGKMQEWIHGAQPGRAGPTVR